MSYINMDHAGWVQRQIEASKRQKPTAAERRAASEAKGWHAAPDHLNTFQQRALNLLGIVGGGIYNAPIGWSGVRWGERQIIVPWRSKGLGTFDFSDLTTFVFLCHEARIRGYVCAGGPGMLSLWLTERESTGGYSRRHPNLDEALAAWRRQFPVDHPIRYCEPAPEVASA
jgi:hypothetical protein